MSMDGIVPLHYNIQKTRWELKEMGVSEPSATKGRKGP